MPADAKRSNEASPFSAFVSYAKPDVKKAQAIAATLEERGFKCWIAPRDVRPGRSYGDEIIRGIEKSRAFVLVLSQASNELAFVAREVERAVSKNKPVFPIRIADVAPSPALELFISGTQWIDAFGAGGLSAPMDQLARQLGEEEGEEGTKRLEGQVAPQVVPPSRRYLKPVALALGVLLFAAAGALLWQYFHHTRVDAATDPDFQACDAGSGETAIAACERAISGGRFTGHDLSLLYNDRGYLRMMKGDLDSALADFEVAIRLDAKNFYPFWNRGTIYAARGDVDRAKADYETALSLNPDDESRKKIEAALKALGRASPPARLSSDSSTDADFQACVKLSGDAGLAACNRAIASGKFAGPELAALYGLRGGDRENSDPDGALSDYTQAIRLDPSHSTEFAGRGFIYAKKGDFDRAIQDYDEAIRLDPSNLPAYGGRARAYQQKGDVANARADYEKVLALNPDPDIKKAVEAALGGLPPGDASVISEPQWIEKQDAAKPQQLATGEEAGDTEMIVGGSPVPEGKFPWEVRLYSSMDDSQGFCAGSIIAPRWVLTTAHCTAMADTIFVGYGSTDRTKTRKLESEQVVVHPGYSERQSDIALIKLKSPIPNALPVDLADDKAEKALLRPGVKLIVPGWGALWDSKDSQVANLVDKFTLPSAGDDIQTGDAVDYEASVSIPMRFNEMSAGVLDQQACKQAYQDLGLPPPGEGEFCATEPSGAADSCAVDSGGPVLVQADTRSGDVQVGIASLGRQHCGNRSVPGVFAKVAPFSEWIAATMKQ